jgi:hypothetical protein
LRRWRRGESLRPRLLPLRGWSRMPRCSRSQTASSAGCRVRRTAGVPRSVPTRIGRIVSVLFLRSLTAVAGVVRPRPIRRSHRAGGCGFGFVPSGVVYVARRVRCRWDERLQLRGFEFFEPRRAMGRSHVVRDAGTAAVCLRRYVVRVREHVRRGRGRGRALGRGTVDRGPGCPKPAWPIERLARIHRLPERLRLLRRRRDKSRTGAHHIPALGPAHRTARVVACGGAVANPRAAGRCPAICR